MNKLTEKTFRFLAALCDVYKDAENRELHMMPKTELEDDITEDITAMLSAMCVLVNKMTGENEDLIGFTYTLNKLAIQCVYESEEEKERDD